jgi:acetyl esterase/lipase
MSLQASALRAAMGLVGGMMTNSGEPPELREKIDNYCKRMPPPPDESSYEPISIGGVPAWWVTMPESDPNKVLLYLHGGGYMFGATMTTHKDLVWRLAQAARCRVLSVDYRLAPEQPFPAGWDDCFSVYQWLLDHYDPRGLAVGGDSAGGGLTFGTLQRVRDQGLPLPAAAVGLSPWTDLACTGESLVTNLEKDSLIPGDAIHEGVPYILQDMDPYNTYASPLYGDQRGMPPTLIQVGSDEVLLDDSRRLARRMEEAGVPVVLDVWNQMPHVWQVMSTMLPEGRVAVERIGIFLRGHMRSMARA